MGEFKKIVFGQIIKGFDEQISAYYDKSIRYMSGSTSVPEADRSVWTGAGFWRPYGERPSPMLWPSVFPFEGCGSNSPMMNTKSC